MKKRILAIAAGAVAVVAIVGVLAFGRGAFAASGKPQLNYGPQLSAGQCVGGTLVLNVTHKLINDPDSSVTGHNWANDSYNKHIQVWQTGADSFCAVVSYEGSFVTTEGNSPANTDASIPAGITGTSEGGYRAYFTGSLVASPGYPTHGNLGTFDYGWDGNDADIGNVTPFDWSQVYFGTDNLNLYWWGWIYRTPHNGTWVNACGVGEQGNTACPGNSGDITG